MDWTAILAVSTVIAVILSVFASQWRLTNFITTKIDAVLERVDRFKEELLDKLQYHERHDNKRFEDIRNNLFAIQLAAARKDQCLDVKKLSTYPRNGKSENF